MKMNFQAGGLILMVMWTFTACIEAYDPPVDANDINLLVVDGYLNASTGIATVKLSRTQPVKGDEAVPTETGASIFIEDSKGGTYFLYEQSAGFYQGAVPTTDPENHYRLNIRTASNRDYASEFIPILQTPPIDSLTWSIKNNGVEIAVNTHDATGLSRHYRWKCEETYQYHANFNSLFRFEGDDVSDRPVWESIFACWKGAEITDIKINSTKHLQESVVSRFPLIFIPQGSIKISVKYSALVRQEALTEDAYAYWLGLERSTEHLGGLFDPLPSEVVGNIRSLNNPAETVIGYFGGGTVMESRIFIQRGELPKAVTGSFNFNPSCQLDTVYLDELPEIHKPSTVLVDAIYSQFGGALIGYSTTVVPCGDCRSLGGTTEEPDFWE